MDLRHLLIFRTVVEKGSFSAAADELEISQPAVSFQIRSLEERLGQRLLDRRGRRVTLTEPGAVLDEYARRLLDLEDEMLRELDLVDTRVAGRLELGSSTGPGELVLPGLCGAFREAHPDVAVRLEVHDTQGVCDRVLAGALELGVVGAARPQRGLEFEVFMRDELVLVAPPGHPLAARAEIGVAELAEAPLVMQQPGSGVRSVLLEAFREAGAREPAPRMELGLQQSVKTAVLDGLGVTVISRLAVEREVADGALVIVPIAGEGLSRDYHWVRPTGRTPRRATTAFLEFARTRVAAGGLG